MYLICGFDRANQEKKTIFISKTMHTEYKTMGQFAHQILASRCTAFVGAPFDCYMCSALLTQSGSAEDAHLFQHSRRLGDDRNEISSSPRGSD